jgi:hypothetical protein
VHKHNIIAVFYVEKETSAFPSLLTLMFGILFAAFMMQVFTGTTLALCQFEDYRLLVLCFCWLACGFGIILRIRGSMELKDKNRGIVGWKMKKGISIRWIGLLVSEFMVKFV